MNFAPNIVELIARARADLRMGVPVVITSQNQSLLIAAAETVSDLRFKDFMKLDNRVALAITSRRAETLKAPVYDCDIARVVTPANASLEWVQSIADPSTDLTMPMKGPLKVEREGECVVYRLAINLTKSAQLLPAAVAVELHNAGQFALDHDITVIPEFLATPHIATTSPLHAVAQAKLPMAASKAGKLHIFRPEDGGEEHYAIEIGKPCRSKPVLARLHSACFTGDVLGSLKCDCGPQLQAALGQMGSEGEGILLYLNQEGRGIGLANKMRAYSLQDQGFDTVEANHRLGFEDDERDFRIGSNILKELGFTSVKLLTNNPKKIKMMEETGIAVTERVPLKVGGNPLNEKYLAIKAQKSGHML